MGGRLSLEWPHHFHPDGEAESVSFLSLSTDPSDKLPFRPPAFAASESYNRHELRPQIGSESRKHRRSAATEILDSDPTLLPPR